MSEKIVLVKGYVSYAIQGAPTTYNCETKLKWPPSVIDEFCILKGLRQFHFHAGNKLVFNYMYFRNKVNTVQ